MGCDIHCYVEKKDKYGIWNKITGFKSGYYDPESEYFSAEEYLNADSPIDSRDYTLFALLANVRNGYGFAGCDTGNAIKPLDMPRGLPENVCNEIRTESDDWECDGHSHSWFKVCELIACPNTTKVSRGFVTFDQYQEYKKEGKPNSWCGGVSGGNVIKCTEEEMEQTVKDNPDKSVYCLVEWKESLRDRLDYFFGDILKQLKKRCDTKDYSDVRIVFWFDN